MGCATNPTGRNEMATEFSTTEYEAAHGRKPSGRGWWIFRDQAGSCWPATSWGTLTQAKKWARKALPKASVIVVCS